LSKDQKTLTGEQELSSKSSPFPTLPVTASDYLFQAFTTLVQKSTEPLLFHFKEIAKEKDSCSPLIEILNAEYQGKIRFFELNFAQSHSILEHLHLPQMPTALIFWKDKTCPEWQGYRNTRNFLRKVLFS